MLRSFTKSTRHTRRSESFHMAEKFLLKSAKIVASSVLEHCLLFPTPTLCASCCAPDNVGVAAGTAVCCSGQVNLYVLAVNFASFDLQHAQLGQLSNGAAGCSWLLLSPSSCSLSVSVLGHPLVISQMSSCQIRLTTRPQCVSSVSVWLIAFVCRIIADFFHTFTHIIGQLCVCVHMCVYVRVCVCGMFPVRFVLEHGRINHKTGGYKFMPRCILCCSQLEGRHGSIQLGQWAKEIRTSRFLGKGKGLVVVVYPKKSIAQCRSAAKNLIHG